MTRLLPLVLLLVAGVVYADSNWLSRASKAVRTTDYRGTLVYLRDGKMDTLRVVHRHREGSERERLISLTGEPREIIRHNGEVNCILPEKRVVLVAKHAMQSLLSNVADMSAETLQDNYTVRDLGERRLADRQCRAIAIEPRDDYRYGYRLLIDAKTDLPLKLDLLQGDEVLEQLMFTDIDFAADIADSELQPTFDTEGFRWVRHQPMRSAKPGGSEDDAEPPPAWRIDDLPPGFSLAESGIRQVDNNLVARQMLFTDGVATVSAFIAPLAERKAFSGETTMGAVNAFGREVDGFQITVVGEVPRITAEMIGNNIRRDTGAAASE